MLWEMISTDGTICLYSLLGEVSVEDQPENENMNPENPNPWNKREKESNRRLYLLVMLLCLLLAYILSGAVK